ncbi:MAG TPA: TonB-dependent siderophore receptor [Pyrinomonadaceae bacterium]|nr:TonB-dependent siderophore receptor [Pyrinomonadaceae bacterium]
MKIKKQGRDHRRRHGRRGPKYWIVAIGAMGVLVAYCPANSHNVVLGKARLEDKPTVSEQQRQLVFDIPADTLEAVISKFQKIADLQVVIPNQAMRAIASPGVRGTFSPEQALREILRGTGISYRFTDKSTAILEIHTDTASVEVREDTRPVLSSPKYTQPLLDTPQTITVISKEVMEEQGATTLRDVLRNVPGLTITAGEGGNPAGDNLTLRGFSARNDIFVDGVRDISPQARDPFNLEQVDVVKGPGSAYTGRGSTGGSINLINKVPGLRRSFAGTLDFGTDSTRRATADMNIPIGDTIGFRLNLLAHHSGVAGRDVVKFDRWGVAPSLTLGLGKPTRLTISYYKLKQDNISDYGIPWVPATNNVLVEHRDRPAPVPRDTFYGFRDRDFEKLNSDLVTLKFERDFNDALSLRNQLRFSNSSRDSMATPPRFASNDSTVINREMRSWITEDKVWDNQTDFIARFSTGGIEHALVTGVNLSRENNTRVTRTAGNSQTTLLNPNPDDIFTGPITISPIVGDVTANSQALYVFDTATLGRKWELNGGLRWDRFDADGITTTGAPVSRVDRMLSVRAGAVFKPLPQGAVYASYGTSLNPSLEGLSYNTANIVIDPEKTYTLEAGSKWDFFNSRVLLSGAIFRVEKLNARTPGILPGDPPQVLEGKQRVDGAELSLEGNLTRAWRILAGYTFLDSETTDSNTPAEIGKELVNTPRNSFNLWTTYSLPSGLHFGGGARFVDSRWGNTINTRRVDAYWTFDVMASYPLTEHIDLKLNLYNLADKLYFDRIGGGHLVPGPGRSAMVSTSFRF